jgi:hypothetical protein
MHTQSRPRSVGGSRTRCPSTREHMSYEAAPGAASRLPRKRAGYNARRHRARRVGLAAEYIVRKGSEWGWIVLVRVTGDYQTQALHICETVRDSDTRGDNAIL